MFFFNETKKMDAHEKMENPRLECLDLHLLKSLVTFLPGYDVSLSCLHSLLLFFFFVVLFILVDYLDYLEYDCHRLHDLPWFLTFGTLSCIKMNLCGVLPLHKVN